MVAVRTMSADPMRDPADRLRPYVAGLVLDWLHDSPNVRHRRITGSLAFVDISGFTALTERLATKGKVGAEEMRELLDATFAALLARAYCYGASLVKWGGDAVLLLFEDDEHAALACRAADEMRRTMRRVGRLRTSAGQVQLRMSVGIDSGEFDFFLTGESHRELLIAGPAATRTALMEQAASAGEIVVSPATAAHLPPGCVGAATGPGFLLRKAPDADQRSRFWIRHPDVDPGDALEPSIRERLRTGVDDSEHRQVAIAFVEVSGVDDLLVRQGPGAVAAALNDLVVLVQQECVRHRITFWDTDISVDGFKIMLIAGAPRSTGHDEDGLVRATRTILDRHRGPVRVRIGMNRGRVFTGVFGPHFRRTWAVNGDAVNLAARVMGKAADGQLLATDATLERVSSALDSQAVEPFTVKGKQQPVRAQLIRSVGAVRSNHPDSTPFVGRAADLDRLQQYVDVARRGQGAHVAVVGDAGMGKTRLVEQLCAPLDNAWSVHRGFGDDYESATPYFLTGNLLRHVLGVAWDAGDDVVVRRLTQRVDRLAPKLAPWLPLLLAAAGIDAADNETTAAVRDEFRGAKTGALVVELLSALLPGPALLVIDDAHSADAVSVDVLARIAAATATRPWLLLTIGRTAVATETAHVVTVGPLPDADAHDLVVHSGGEGFAPHVVRSVIARAEGNPLFLRELTAAVANAGSDELPETLEELLAAYVDDLPPAEQKIVRVAAVLGQRIDDELLAELLDGDRIDAQTWTGLDRFFGTDSSGERAFRTKLLRDAAYEGLPYRRRQELHGRAATAIETRAAGHEADVAESLSLHTSAAGRYDDAWRYSLLAGERARSVYAHTEALVFFGRARSAARRLPHIAPEDQAALLESIGDEHARLAELPRALSAYQEARRLAPASARLLRSRAALSAGLAVERAGARARAARWLTIAQREAEADRDTDPKLAELAACIRVERAYLQYTTGRYADAAALCRQAIAQAEAVGADYVVGRALHLMDLVDLRVGRGSDERRVRRALALFERCGDVPRQAGVWNHLGMAAYFAGDWDGAVSHYRQAQAAHERSGDELSAAIVRTNIGEILVDQGHLDEAEPLVTEGLRVWRASGTPSDIGFGAALLGRLVGRRGRYAEALTLLGEAATAYAAKDEREKLIDVELRRAEVLLLHGAARPALDHLDRAQTQLFATLRLGGGAVTSSADSSTWPALPGGAALLRLRGCATRQLGDRAAAIGLLDQSVALARRARSAHELALALSAQRWAGGGSAADGAEAERLSARLGVAWTPTLPLAAAVGPDLPPQRRDEVRTRSSAGRPPAT
jgi:class 3 adenylate cyclase/tetratricopeptide (TPR) repeat protein